MTMKNTLLKISLSLSSILLLNTTSLCAENNATTLIDALVIYSPGSAAAIDGDVETKIDHFMTTTNKIYEDSGLNIQLKSVKIQEFDLDESADSGQVLTDTKNNAEINALRDTVGADEVIMYRPYANDGACGIAYVNTNNDAFAYAHVSIDCPSYVTAHEVGHNMSLWHSAKQDPDAGYARGHGVQEQFTTIMAYSSAYNGAKIYKFSDPDLDCNGEPCGIEVGLDNEADAVKAILAQAPVIENYREHVVVDDTNNTDDNNSTDNNNTDLEAAKKAYEDQLIVVENSKTELDRLRADISVKRIAANTTFRETIQEAFATYRESRSIPYATLRAEYKKLRTQYRTARKNYRQRKISRAAFIAIIRTIRTEQKNVYATYRQSVKTIREQLIATITTARAERRATIQAAKDAYQTYRTEVYLVDVARLAELKKIYDDLLAQQ